MYRGFLAVTRPNTACSGLASRLCFAALGAIEAPAARRREAHHEHVAYSVLNDGIWTSTAYVKSRFQETDA